MILRLPGISRCCLEWVVGHRSERCWLLDKQCAAELPGECFACLYKKVWANVSWHSIMQKEGLTGYLGSNENIFLRAAGIRGTATPVISITIAAPMGEAGQFTGGAPWWLGLELLFHEERLGEAGCSAGEETALGAPNYSPTEPTCRLLRQRQALHRGVRWEDKRQRAQAESSKFQAGCKEKPFHQGSQVEQASQQGHAVSIAGYF